MRSRNQTMDVIGRKISFTQTSTEDFISITDIAKYKNPESPADIALEFASWVSVEFKFYLIKEFQGLKSEQEKGLDWNIKRNLAKINYRIHTDAIKGNLVPEALSQQAINQMYASEADVLNVALFGKTTSQWRAEHSDKSGNIRDYANVTQLVCLANMGNLNTVFINDGLAQQERLVRLNQIAIQQMGLLVENKTVKKLAGK